MPCADLSNKNGSPHDGAPSAHTRTRTRDGNNVPSPQQRRASRYFTSAADSFTGRGDDGADADESGSDSDEEGGYINSDIGSTWNDGQDVSMARAMRNSAKRCVNKQSRWRGGSKVRKEIVVSPYKPSSSLSKSSARVEERDNATGEDYRARLSNETAQLSSTREHRSVRRTYAGLRKINGTPVSSRADHDLSCAPRYSGFRPSSVAPGDNLFSAGDSSLNSALLDHPSRGTDSKTDGRRGASCSTPTGSRSIPKRNATSKSSPLQPGPDRNYSRNLFYASLSNAIDGQGREVQLEKHKRTSKPESNIKQPSDNGITTPQSSKPIHRSQQSQDRTTRHRISFYGVVISPRPLPVPREMYKSVDEYIAQEEEEELSSEKLRRQKRKGREAIDGEIFNRLKPGPIKELSKQRKAIQKVIYVSSSSDVPVAGSSKANFHRRSDRSGDGGVRETRGIASTHMNVDPSSEGEQSSLEGLPKKKYSSEASSVPVKRIRKRRRADVVTSSSSGSASEVRKTSNRTLLGENARTPTHRYGRPRRSTSAPPPPESGRSNASEQRAELLEREDRVNHDHAVTRSPDDVAEELAIEGNLLRDVSATPGADSFSLPPASASFHKDSAPPSSEVLPEIVISTKPPSTPSIPADKRSTQPGSPTLCSSSAHNRLPTLSPSSRSTTLAVFQEDIPPNAASEVSENEMSVEKMKAKAKLKTNAGASVNSTQNSEDDDQRDSDKEGDQAEQGQNILPSSSDEEDDVCHRCRSRNVYAKMKCTNPKRHGLTCSLHYCHRCIVVYFPKIEFDPYSPDFVCPSCMGFCDCVGCLRKRGIVLTAQRRDVKRWDQLGVTLLLSQQETRRRERQEMRRAAGLPDLPKEASKSIKRRPRLGMPVQTSVDIGDEAKQWIKEQMAGKKHVRVFIGAWQDTWGPVPFCVHEMAGVDFDIHAADGAVRGKGKARAVDPSVRLFVGNSKGLHRPFVRAEDVLVSNPALSSPEPEPAKKRARRKRKLAQDTAAAIYVTPGCTATESWAVIPNKKKRRLARASTHALSIPEFTVDHQGSSASSMSATSTSYHPTPDDFAPSTFLGLDLPPRRNQMRHLYPNPGSGSGVGNDPVLGVMNINGPLNSDGLVSPDMDAEWDMSIGSGTKQHPGMGDFTSYDGMYDSYAAALGGVGPGMGTGVDGFDGAFDYEAVRTSMSPVRRANETTDKGGSSQTSNVVNSKDANSRSGDSDKFMQVLDPAILEAETNASRSSERNAASQALNYNLHQDPDGPDPMQFLTAHGRENALLTVPMIYGVPSSTGLSLHDLERTLKESLNLISN